MGDPGPFISKRRTRHFPTAEALWGQGHELELVGSRAQSPPCHVQTYKNSCRRRTAGRNRRHNPHGRRGTWTSQNGTTMVIPASGIPSYVEHEHKLWLELETKGRGSSMSHPGHADHCLAHSSRDAWGGGLTKTLPSSLLTHALGVACSASLGLGTEPPWAGTLPSVSRNLT